jgi:hypothetical protein
MLSTAPPLGTSVPWMRALLGLPRFGGATHANGNDNRSRHREVGLSGSWHRCGGRAATRPAAVIEGRAFSLTNSTGRDCETRIRKLEASQAEGEERLSEKHLVIEYCASRYKNDKTIERLVKECAKYEEQPVVKQQFVAECQLAAFNYANTLYVLKAEYRK